MSWREREKGRFNAGLYKTPIWFRKKLLKEIPDHFVHMSNVTPGLIAYTQDETNGERDIQTTTKPGRYLKKFYPDLSANSIRDLATIIEDDNLVVEFAKTPAEIEEVYVKGPNSCMSAERGRYGTPVHPVHVYGNSDLQLAYIKRNGRITARALVWPEKKRHGRIYGDSARMKLALESLGYESRPLFGAKLNLIVSGDRYPKLVMPYIDGSCSVRFNKKNELIIAGPRAVGRIGAGGTNGYSNGGYFCRKCMKMKGDTTLFTSMVVKSNDALTTQYFCKPCVEQNETWRCAATRVLVSMDIKPINVYSKKTVTVPVLPNTKTVHTHVKCELTDVLVLYKSSAPFSIGGKVMRAAIWALEENGFKMAENGAWYPKKKSTEDAKKTKIA